MAPRHGSLHALGRFAQALLAGSVLSVTTTSLPAAAAEAGVVEVRRSDAKLPPRARAIAERVLDSSGAAVLGIDEMARRLRLRARPPPAADARTFATLERETSELLEAVAFGRDEETLARSRAALRREGARLCAINRTEAAARALGNVCLFAVRALLHRADAKGARQQAGECLRTEPDLEPSSEMHPPEVLSLITSIRSESAELGVLSVTAVEPVPSACELFVQGRPAGKLPVELELVPGTYALQAQCGAGTPGPIRNVVASAGHSERVLLAPRLERALQAEAPSVLRSAQGADALRTEDLAALGEWLSLTELWVLERRGSAVSVTRFRGASNVGNALEVPLDPSQTFERRFATALCEATGCERNRSSPGKPSLGAGIAGAVGGAAMLGSWAAFARHQSLDADMSDLLESDPRYEQKKRARDRDAAIAVVATGAGAATFVASAPFWLPERRTVPWWAWSAGVAGAGAVGFGTYLWIREDRFVNRICAPGERACQRRSPLVPLAPMLVTQGASLLAIPATYLVRGIVRSNEPVLQFGAAPHGGISVAWIQRFSGY